MTINVGDKVRIKDVGEVEFPGAEWDGLVGEVVSIVSGDEYEGWTPAYPYVVEVDNTAVSTFTTSQEFSEAELEVVNA